MAQYVGMVQDIVRMLFLHGLITFRDSIPTSACFYSNISAGLAYLLFLKALSHF